ncbi:MAG: hypothetical protein AVDCRST_MAG10-3376 [uncultured Acidimicrobiales bacterium]|uniref:DUF58 domain-containing protein n=1 Tax=uncultured Acidimicrobiales bacterium TaxID=310071 RepID=A0A6J4J7A3_9ACTN|nr:MAG: hypothetical protein AVDCRST_MAG10-3376 [uncultured Acidimicrobiales bacterium]
MLTRRGWALTVGGLLLALAGRLLGLLELYVLAAGCWALMGMALAFLATHPADVQARRALTPHRVRAGDESVVELTVSNRGRRPTPVVELRDPVDGGPRRARLLMAPLRPGAAETAHYRIPTERRGVLTVGPLEARRFDPLALSTRASVVADVSELVVYPLVEELLPLPHAPGDDRRGGFRRATAVGAAGDDFYALRPWVVGDDLRQVHWPSTARRDELMVRQHDVPWQGRATVVLDIRSRYHDADSLEQAVSAAASIATSSGQGGSLLRLITTDGGDSAFGNGPGHLEALLERLARIEAGPGELPDLPQTSGAVALVVTADVPAADLSHLARLGGRPGSLTLVVIARNGRDTPAAAPGTMVLVGRDQPLAPAWNQAMARAGVMRGAAG